MMFAEYQPTFPALRALPAGTVVIIFPKTTVTTTTKTKGG